MGGNVLHLGFLHGWVPAGVLQSAPSDTLQRRLIEQHWSKRLSQPHSLLQLINRDDGIDALSLD